MNSRIRLIFIIAPFAFVAGCSGKKDDSETTDAAKDQAALVADSQEVSSAELENLVKLVDQIAAEAATLPRAEFDPVALAKQLGDDPQSHFEWVRDHTWWAPYRGLLRGSKGVMLDRVGSNLDRAVLLADLLRNSGHAVRLAHAKLSETQARDLLEKLRPIPAQRRATAPGKLTQQLTERAKDVADQATSLARTQADQLYAAVRNVADSAPLNDDQAAVAALQDHWWVEREEKGKWIPMDMLLPDAKVGSQLIAAANWIDWEANEKAPLIADSDWHSVRIRVVVERYEAGATSESVVLESTLRPAVVLDRPITLGHFPLQWPENVPDPQSDPNALGNAAVNVREWMPYLTIGGEIIAQSALTDTGDVKADPLNPQSDISEVGGGSLFGGFDDALSGGAQASSLTAEWIDYEISYPGGPRQKLRRPLFDLLGPANRAAKSADFDATTNELLISRSEALLSTTDILLQPAEFTSEFVAELLSSSIVSRQKDFRNLARERDSLKVRELATQIVDKVDKWSPLIGFALWRNALGRELNDSFIDRPNVLNYRLSPPVVNADATPWRQLIDVASNSVGVRRNATRNAFQTRLQQGVADTVAETLALGGNPRTSENTASVFSISGAGPEQLRILKPRASNEVRRLELPADTAARIAATVESGYLVIAPAQQVEIGDQLRFGWWRVDPVSGETIGVMDTGFHTTTTENVQLRVALDSLRRELVITKANLGHGARGAMNAKEARIYDLASKLLDDVNILLHKLGGPYFP